jgi:DNA-directed RNA polymerase specialized sigma24 family protein
MYPTAHEVRLAIECLTPADYIRLRMAARIYLGGSAYAEPRELVVDALATAYMAAAGAGGRRWKRGVDFMAYLVMTIRGLASDSRRSADRRWTSRGSWEPAPPDSAALAMRSPEQERLADEERGGHEEQNDANLELVMNHFKNDPEVCWIIKGIMDGIPASRIQKQSGMTSTQYDSAQRRWRRGLDRLFPGRRQ